MAGSAHRSRKEDDRTRAYRPTRNLMPSASSVSAPSEHGRRRKTLITNHGSNTRSGGPYSCPAYRGGPPAAGPVAPEQHLGGIPSFADAGDASAVKLRYRIPAGLRPPGWTVQLKTSL